MKLPLPLNPTWVSKCACRAHQKHQVTVDIEVFDLLFEHFPESLQGPDDFDGAHWSTCYSELARISQISSQGFPHLPETSVSVCIASGTDVFSCFRLVSFPLTALSLLLDLWHGASSWSSSNIFVPCLPSLSLLSCRLHGPFNSVRIRSLQLSVCAHGAVSCASLRIEWILKWTGIVPSDDNTSSSLAPDVLWTIHEFFWICPSPSPSSPCFASSHGRLDHAYLCLLGSPLAAHSAWSEKPAWTLPGTPMPCLKIVNSWSRFIQHSYPPLWISSCPDSDCGF